LLDFSVCLSIKLVHLLFDLWSDFVNTILKRNESSQNPARKSLELISGKDSSNALLHLGLNAIEISLQRNKIINFDMVLHFSKNVLKSRSSFVNGGNDLSIFLFRFIIRVVKLFSLGCNNFFGLLGFFFG
jgi:hypothetical protein